MLEKLKNQLPPHGKQICCLWLEERDIVVDKTLNKPEIYEVVKDFKSATRIYKLDTLMEEFGHAVKRLPPYQPQQHPIEKIWANDKNW